MELDRRQYFDVAVRDAAWAIAAFTLVRLIEAGIGAEAKDRAGAQRAQPREDCRLRWAGKLISFQNEMTHSR